MAFNPDGDAEETAREDKGRMNGVVDEPYDRQIIIHHCDGTMWH